jgi:hypothetical protein
MSSYDWKVQVVTDTVGGIVGALLGELFIRRAKKKGGQGKVAGEIEKMGN